MAIIFIEVQVLEIGGIGTNAVCQGVIEYFDEQNEGITKIYTNQFLPFDSNNASQMNILVEEFFKTSFTTETGIIITPTDRIFLTGLFFK